MTVKIAGINIHILLCQIDHIRFSNCWDNENDSLLETVWFARNSCTFPVK